jgi:hypothetical protein
MPNTHFISFWSNSFCQYFPIIFLKIFIHPDTQFLGFLKLFNDLILAWLISYHPIKILHAFLVSLYTLQQRPSCFFIWPSFSICPPHYAVLSVTSCRLSPNILNLVFRKTHSLYLCITASKSVPVLSLQVHCLRYTTYLICYALCSRGSIVPLTMK